MIKKWTIGKVSLSEVSIVNRRYGQAKGKSEEDLSDFTFLYTDWFYCVHLLSYLFDYLAARKN
ncbi:hypothetical protein PN471_20185 [Aphanizomenon sp. CS-733/32]|uniref:hypothetical protein n=1 Tax=Aphanizomenon sp. CS-733/32 TaxID=3021715 RepID=UPI00232C0814|nr:hypothetical protein [Aphanizomenon sp. CS-733/32]MDB9310902.1 hypothetical protein [Aphanizomenon sp. CS-733/32]